MPGHDFFAGKKKIKNQKMIMITTSGKSPMFRGFRGLSRGLSGGLSRGLNRNSVSSGFRTTPIVTKRFLSQDPQVRINEIVNIVKANPNITQVLKEFESLVEDKNFFKEGNPPNMMQIAKLLMDNNVRQCLQKLKAEFEKANINFSPEDITMLMKHYGIQK